MTEYEAVWVLVGKLGAVIAVIVGIISGVKYLWGMTPTAKLETRVSEVELAQKKDYEHMKEIESKLQSVSDRIQDTDDELKKLNEGINRIGKSQILLLRHFVTGNGQKEMMQEADDLTTFFVER